MNENMFEGQTLTPTIHGNARTKCQVSEIAIVESQTIEQTLQRITMERNFWKSENCGTKWMAIAVPMPPPGIAVVAADNQYRSLKIYA